MRNTSQLDQGGYPATQPHGSTGGAPQYPADLQFGGKWISKDSHDCHAQENEQE